MVDQARRLKLPEKRARYNDRAATNGGRPGGDFPLAAKFAETPLQPVGEFIGPVGSLTGVKPSASLARSFLCLQILGAMIPIVDFLLKPGRNFASTSRSR